MIVQACVNCCTCFSTQRSVSWTIQLSSVPNCLCEPVAVHSFRIILEALQCRYSEPPLVSLRHQQYNFISVHIMVVGLRDLLSVELSLVAFCQLLAVCSYQKQILKFCLLWRGTLMVVQLVEALRYMSEGRGFDSRYCHCNISLTYFSGRTMALGLTQPNTNEHQEYFLGGKGGRCVGLTTLPLTFADCLEIWEPHLPGTLRACPGL
jgi:hypothetical protein